MQHRFVVKLFTAAKEMGIHTALDTNGYFGDKLSDADLETIDLVLLDIKTWDPERHRHLTGMDIGPTLDFARRLASRKRQIWLRYVLVPGLTDDPADVEQIAAFVASLGNVERVDVLPFHQMGQYKWKQLGIPYTLEEKKPPTNEVVDRTIGIYKSEGLMTY